jgi:hypothetical protein
MKPLYLALRYLEIFYSGNNIDELSQILAGDLTFEGPFYKFESAKDYIESLRKDPPVGMKYELLRSFQSESFVCLIYRFAKPGISIPMAQIFEVEDERIKNITLIFDTAPFTGEKN